MKIRNKFLSVNLKSYHPANRKYGNEALGRALQGGKWFWEVILFCAYVKESNMNAYFYMLKSKRGGDSMLWIVEPKLLNYFLCLSYNWWSAAVWLWVSQPPGDSTIITLLHLCPGLLMFPEWATAAYESKLCLCQGSTSILFPQHPIEGPHCQSTSNLLSSSLPFLPSLLSVPAVLRGDNCCDIHRWNK